MRGGGLVGEKNIDKHTNTKTDKHNQDTKYRSTRVLSLNLKLVWGTRVSAKKILGKGVCLFNNETPKNTPLFNIY